MHIGLITGEYPPLRGGIGAYTDILARELHQQGHQVSIFSNAHTEQQSPEITLMNNITKWNYSAVRQMQQWADANAIDILNLQFQTAAYDMSAWVHFLPQLTNTPFVTTFHDLRFPYLFPKAGKLRSWIVNHLAKQSDSLIVTNHEDYQQVQHLNPTLIPIGSNITSQAEVNTDQWRSKLNLAADDFVIAHFGFLNHSKGIDTLLQALNHHADVKLIMIGGRTGTADPTNITYSDTVEARIEDLNLSSQVIWTGYIEENEVSAYLQSADIVALPFRDGASFRRGSLMAAIQQGCAIITTYPTVTIPEFTPDNLYLIPIDDPSALSEAISHLKTNPDHRAQLKRNITALHPKFDWSVIASDTVKVFEQVLSL